MYLIVAINYHCRKYRRDEDVRVVAVWRKGADGAGRASLTAGICRPSCRKHPNSSPTLRDPGLSRESTRDSEPFFLSPPILAHPK